MKDINIEEMHKILLDILVDIDAFCRYNNIKYSLGGGTLLGAVRHNGFIPWDDDVDIMMTRENYDRFISSYNDGHSEIYQLIDCIETESIQFVDAFAKVHDVRTICNEKRLGFAKYGINIDVFPIDGMPTSIKLCKCFFFINGLIARGLNLRNEKISQQKTLFSIILWIWFNCIALTVHKFLRNHILSFFDFNCSKYAGAVVGAYGLKERYRKDVFCTYRNIKFENKDLMSISDTHTYLMQHYGKNYMELPPIEKRISHSSSPQWL